MKLELLRIFPRRQIVVGLKWLAAFLVICVLGSAVGFGVAYSGIGLGLLLAKTGLAYKYGHAIGCFLSVIGCMSLEMPIRRFIRRTWKY